MTEEKFWNTTPRKFFALMDAHNRANSVDDDENKKEAEPLTLEELRAMR